MVLGCKGLCENERDVRGINYDDGWKRCSTCSKKMMYDGVRCYCCNYPLRTNPRKLKFKKELSRY